MTSGATPQDVGIGVSRIPERRTQPTGSEGRAKTTVRLAAEGAANDFSPQRKRAPTPALVVQRGKAAQQRIPAPDLEKVGHLV